MQGTIVFSYFGSYTMGQSYMGGAWGSPHYIKGIYYFTQSSKFL